MSRFSEQQIEDGLVGGAYNMGASYARYQIFRAITKEIESLDKEDAVGHIYWGKFLKLVLEQDPTIANVEIIFDELPY